MQPATSAPSAARQATALSIAVTASGVEPICHVLTEAGAKFAPSTYYATKSRSPSARSVTDAATTAEIKRGRTENDGVYGCARCTPSCAGKAGRWPAASSPG
jgi:hypothetical protein